MPNLIKKSWTVSNKYTMWVPKMSGSDNNFLVWFGGSKEAKNASRIIDLTSKELPCTLFFLNSSKA